MRTFSKKGLIIEIVKERKLQRELVETIGFSLWCANTIRSWSFIISIYYGDHNHSGYYEFILNTGEKIMIYEDLLEKRL